MADPSPSSSWLSQLHQVLLRFRLPARDILLTDGMLTIDFEFVENTNLTIEIRPWRRGEAHFARTRRFSIRYRRPGDLHPQERMGLEKFSRLMCRIEDRIPSSLDGVGGHFVSSDSERQRFLRLFPCCTVEESRSGEEHITEVMVRMTSACNQKCPFCTAPEHGIPSREVLAELFRRVGEVFPSAMVSLSGGEPTLRPDFVEEVAMALESPGIGQVQVQTNAVLFADHLDPAALAPHDRLSFFVSMHGVDPGTYDRCTGTRGQFPLAMKGLQKLMDAGHAVTINCVINAINWEHLGQYVKTLGPLLSGRSKADLHFSTLICPESKPGAQDFLVSYSCMARGLRDVLREAKQGGIAVQSLQASTHASMPACVVDEEERNRNPHLMKALPHETGLEEEGRPWVKKTSCAACVYDQYCLGVPRPYALRFGLDELQPLREI